MSALDERDCAAAIRAYTLEDWQPLFALIPAIEAAMVSDAWDGGGASQDDTPDLAMYTQEPLVSQFITIVNDIPIMIGFDWARWDAGRAMVAGGPFDYDSVDLVTKCKLISAIVRNDRFCDGALASSFASGIMYKIIRSIEDEVRGRGGAQPTRGGGG
ncbi:MAG: DUF6508 domain-containing protein [Armatimonadetes bacterium]|nr:DUF6508 domain-containing protein [Armatimonadota bacterium]